MVSLQVIAEVVLEEVGYTSEKMAASMGSGEPVLGGRPTMDAEHPQFPRICFIVRSSEERELQKLGAHLFLKFSLPLCIPTNCLGLWLFHKNYLYCAFSAKHLL